MKHQFTLRHGGTKRLIILTMCLITVLLVAWSRIPAKQPKVAPQQRAKPSRLRNLTSHVYLACISSHGKSEHNDNGKDLLTTIQEESCNVTCFPIELVLCDRMIREYYDFEQSKNSRVFGESQDEDVHARRIRYSKARWHYESMRLFRTDRYLDLTFENYIPLSRIINSARVSKQDDIQHCLDYLPVASPKERALIFASFYIYIERLYTDGTQWGDDPNSLDDDEERLANKLLKAMRKKESSDKVAFLGRQDNFNVIARQWQVSFRRLFWNLMHESSNQSVFLIESSKPWILTTLDSPDTFLYSLELMYLNSTLREAPQPYEKFRQRSLPISVDANKLDELFTSSTDTPLSYLNGFGDVTGYGMGGSKPVPDIRITNALFYPERTEILTNYADLLLPEEDLNDQAQAYLLSQFFFLRIGYRYTDFQGAPCCNDVVNQDDMTVGEIATRLLEEIDFISTPVSVDED